MDFYQVLKIHKCEKFQLFDQSSLKLPKRKKIIENGRIREGGWSNHPRI